MFDLNGWHHAVHQVTGEMALRFNKAKAADLQCWAAMLRAVATEMDTAVAGYTEHGDEKSERNP
jgi:hypothetical protein